MPNKGRCDVFGTLFHETPLSIYVHCFALHSSRQEKKKVKRDSGPQSGAKKRCATESRFEPAHRQKPQEDAHRRQAECRAGSCRCLCNERELSLVQKAYTQNKRSSVRCVAQLTWCTAKLSNLTHSHPPTEHVVHVCAKGDHVFGSGIFVLLPRPRRHRVTGKRRRKAGAAQTPTPHTGAWPCSVFHSGAGLAECKARARGGNEL